MTESGNEMVMPVAPMMGGYGNGGFGNWGSDVWIILLVLFAFGGFGGFGMGGFGGGYMGGYDFPWLLASNANNQNATQNGFDNLATNNAINALQSAVTGGFSDVQLGIAGINNNICGSTGQIVQAVNNGFAQSEIAANSRQMANMQQAFANQAAMAQGFNGVQAQLAQASSDNRLGIADLKYTVASENCADRAVSTQNTQSIITAINTGIQSIKDDLCADRLDAERRENQNLRTQLSMAQLAASQVAQTADIRAGQNASVNALVNELRSCPIPAQPVFGNQPIFQCNGGYNGGCGCNGGFYN